MQQGQDGDDAVFPGSNRLGNFAESPGNVNNNGDGDNYDRPKCFLFQFLADGRADGIKSFFFKNLTFQNQAGSRRGANFGAKSGGLEFFL